MSSLKTIWTETRQATASALGLLILRGGCAALMLPHGLQKLQGFSVKHDSFPDPLGVGSTLSMALAIFAELVCSSLLILGLATRFAALNLVITMGVAALIVHANDPFKAKELALLYGVGFTAVLLAGPGKLSLDHLVWNKLGKKQAS